MSGQHIQSAQRIDSESPNAKSGYGEIGNMDETMEKWDVFLTHFESQNLGNTNWFMGGFKAWLVTKKRCEKAGKTQIKSIEFFNVKES